MSCSGIYLQETDRQYWKKPETSHNKNKIGICPLHADHLLAFKRCYTIHTRTLAMFNINNLPEIILSYKAYILPTP
jgi:hypothetical protein